MTTLSDREEKTYTKDCEKLVDQPVNSVNGKQTGKMVKSREVDISGRSEITGFRGIGKACDVWTRHIQMHAHTNIVGITMSRFD